ncbi:hypothetical protein BACCAP_03635 [Pseudoflavonifractor capillosus ATCC 29799]|uniref:Uncharacterized protein n=1 Tax=Pseudoflavonifractor capillosus ATCC 29799 TaxID=411467 RepID=A6NZI5_9FIRM|nr:hypothetical protein BACCAP_03635 [Pseudoflavonifractor capillosus ATCC 29799]
MSCRGHGEICIFPPLPLALFPPLWYDNVYRISVLMPYKSLCT